LRPVAVDLFDANGQPVAVAQVTYMLLNRQRAKKIRQLFTSVPVFRADRWFKWPSAAASATDRVKSCR
jgi:hypothetical protein